MADVGVDLIRELLVLEARAASGVLEVHGPQGVVAFIYMREGTVIFAEASTMGVTLPSWLIANGHITRQQYGEVIQQMTDALVDNEQVRFGEIAIEAGFTDPATVSEGLSALVSGRVVDSLAATVSERVFDEDPEALEGIPHFPVQLGRALLEGLEEHFDEARLIPLLRDVGGTAWRLVEPTQIGHARFGWNRAQMSVVRQFRVARRPQDVLAEASTGATGEDAEEQRADIMRAMLLLWLSGLVAEPGRREVSQSVTSARPAALVTDVVDIASPALPAMARPLEADVITPSIPSMRPPPAAPRARSSIPPRAPQEVRLVADPPSRPRRKKPAASAALRRLQRRRKRSAPKGASPDAEEIARSLKRVARKRKASEQNQASDYAAQIEAAEKAFTSARNDVLHGAFDIARQKLDFAAQVLSGDEFRLYHTFVAFQGSTGNEASELREKCKTLLTRVLREDRQHAFARYVGGRMKFAEGEMETAHKAFRVAARLQEGFSEAERWSRLVATRIKK